MRTVFILLAGVLAACADNRGDSFGSFRASLAASGDLCCEVGEPVGVVGRVTITADDDDVFIRVIDEDPLLSAVPVNDPVRQPDPFPKGGGQFLYQSNVTFDIFITACPSTVGERHCLQFQIAGVRAVDGFAIVTGGPIETVCITSKQTVGPPPPPPVTTFPALAVFPATVLTGLEGLLYDTRTRSLWIGARDGAAEYDATSGDRLDQTGSAGDFPSFLGEFYAATPLRRSGSTVSQAGTGEREGLLTIGPSDAFLRLKPGGVWSDFGQLVVFGQNVTDAVYLVGQEGGSDLLLSHGSVTSLFFDAGQDGWTSAPIAFFGTAITGGGAISAIARELDGQRLIVTNGQPGQLQSHVGSNTTRTTWIGDTGDEPRRIRAAGRLAAISNFGSGTLTLVRWETDGTVEILGTVAVGDSPIGLDVRETGTDYRIVSTGFNDDTLTITIVEKTGLTVVSSTTVATPAGVTGPGHAIWLDDTHIALTGNTSNNFAIREIATLLE